MGSHTSRIIHSWLLVTAHLTDRLHSRQHQMERKRYSRPRNCLPNATGMLHLASSLEKDAPICSIGSCPKGLCKGLVLCAGLIDAKIYETPFRTK